MKINQDYVKRLLEACQAFDNPTFDIEDLRAAGFDYHNKEFEFHMMILTEQGLIRQDDGDRGFGLIKGLDGFSTWSVLPLRLTASGHQFIEALSNKEVWATIKHTFQDANITTLKDVSMKLLDAFMKQKIDKLLGA